MHAWAQFNNTTCDIVGLSVQCQGTNSEIGAISIYEDVGVGNALYKNIFMVIYCIYTRDNELVDEIWIQFVLAHNEKL